jgi:hypothetical protein
MRSILLPFLAACTWIGADELTDRLASPCEADCGRVIAEALPDTTVAEMLPGTSTLEPSSLVAQDVGLVSGVGLVDTFTGSSVLDPAVQGWNGTNDSDAFTLRVPAETRVRLTATWPDSATDLDFGIWADDLDLGYVDLISSYGPDSCLTGDHPTVCESNFVFVPDVAYQLLAMGYLGDGEEAYTIELEWMGL